MTLLTILNGGQAPDDASPAFPPAEPDTDVALAGRATAGAAMAEKTDITVSDDTALVTEDGVALLTEDGKILIAAEAGYYKLRGGEASFTVHRASATVIGTAVRTNQLALQLAALSLLASLDAKLELLRTERSNSEDPAQYEDLKRRVEEFLAACAANNDAPIVATTLSLADGLRGWWTKDHANICNRAFNIGLFAGGLSICAAAGALGPISVVTVGTLIAGKNISGALEACAKLLKRDQPGAPE
jgi:hypothetical protein